MAVPQRIPEGKIRLTYEDYVLLPNDRNRYEILDGELSVTAAPSPKHQAVILNLLQFLDPFIRGHNLGRIYIAPIDLILEPTTVVQPDLLFLSHAHLGFVTDRGIEGPPDLIVEILSPATARADRVTKAQIYARSRVPHYWLVDPDEGSLEAYELSGESYQLVSRLTGQTNFAPSLFPGLTIDLSLLWV